MSSEGWICPKCGRALAPWVSTCPCYLENMKVTCNGTNTSEHVGYDTSGMLTGMYDVVTGKVLPCDPERRWPYGDSSF